MSGNLIDVGICFSAQMQHLLNLWHIQLDDHAVNPDSFYKLKICAAIFKEKRDFCRYIQSPILSYRTGQ